MEKKALRFIVHVFRRALPRRLSVITNSWEQPIDRISWSLVFVCVVMKSATRAFGIGASA